MTASPDIERARHLIHACHQRGDGSLDLGDLGLDDDAFAAIVPEIVLLPILRLLNLGQSSEAKVDARVRNQLTALPPTLFLRQRGLRVLKLWNNRLTLLPEEIGLLDKLEHLVVTSNRLTALPAEIGRLGRLRTLALGGNLLTAIPAEIGELTLLSTLFLGPNRLAGIPDTLGNLSDLTTLELNGNNLLDFPVALLSLRQLELLNIRGNKLTSLPDGIGDLALLKTLTVANNNLTALPDSIGRLTALEHLEVTGNRITSLPETICNLLRLKSLRAGSNQLSTLSPSLHDHPAFMHFLNNPFPGGEPQQMVNDGRTHRLWSRFPERGNFSWVGYPPEYDHTGHIGDLPQMPILHRRS